MEKKLIINGKDIKIDLIGKIGNQASFIFNGVEYNFVKAVDSKGRSFLVHAAINSKMPIAFLSKGVAFISSEEIDFKIETPSKGRSKKSEDGGSGHMISPMPGKILKVRVKCGDKVAKGDALLVMEAMKMEHTVKASCSGIVDKLYYNEGDQVDGGVELISISENEEEL